MTILHKWVATVAIIGTFLWGGLAYYVTMEDTKLRLELENRLLVIEHQQIEDAAVNKLVINIDKKLSNIEQAVKQQSELMKEVRDLRKEVTELQIRLNIQQG